MPPEIGPKKGKSIFEMPPTLLFHGLTWLLRDNELSSYSYKHFEALIWSEGHEQSGAIRVHFAVLLFPRSENCDACLFPILLSLEIGSICYSLRERNDSHENCARRKFRNNNSIRAHMHLYWVLCSLISPFVLRMRDRAQIAHWLSSQVCKRSIDCTLERLCVNTVIRSCSLRFISTLHLSFRSTLGVCSVTS